MAAGEVLSKFDRFIKEFKADVAKANAAAAKANAAAAEANAAAAEAQTDAAMARADASETRTSLGARVSKLESEIGTFWKAIVDLSPKYATAEAAVVLADLLALVAHSLIGSPLESVKFAKSRGRKHQWVTEGLLVTGECAGVLQAVLNDLSSRNHASLFSLDTPSADLQASVKRVQSAGKAVATAEAAVSECDAAVTRSKAHLKEAKVSGADLTGPGKALTSAVVAARAAKAQLATAHREAARVASSTPRCVSTAGTSTPVFHLCVQGPP
jgi:multidrug resistance efflux pump